MPVDTCRNVPGLAFRGSDEGAYAYAPFPIERSVIKTASSCWLDESRQSWLACGWSKLATIMDPLNL